MLEKLCKMQGLDSGRTAAVGDGVNDIVLVDRCGLGVAVENADYRVLAVSDATTGSHHDDGVADLIHDLLDGRLLLGGTRL
jgi:hydroxymethylpyrimidine pyrophosphatase-like HAD family hydrolase